MDKLEAAVYTVDEIQQILRISRKSAYKLINDPPFPVRTVLGQIRIPKQGFDSWLYAQSNDAENIVSVTNRGEET